MEAPARPAAPERVADQPRDVVAEVNQIIRNWEDEHQNNIEYNPIPMLSSMAEIIEAETENFLKMDPDPFDERHPSRTDPECKLGSLLKLLFKKESFMLRLTNDYLRDNYYSRLGITGRDINELNAMACRLLLDILPGLEVSAVFQPDMDSLIMRLIKWTTSAVEPLQTYATGLLAAAMEVAEIAMKYREHNARLVPLLLQRLRSLRAVSDFNYSTTTRPFAHFARSPLKERHIKEGKEVKENGAVQITNSSPNKRKQEDSPPDSPSANIQVNGTTKRQKLRDSEIMSPPRTTIKTPIFNESSNSSWAEMESFMIGCIQIHPITPVTSQVLILRYLVPVGEYQEFLSHVFEHDALELILSYVNVRETKQARLAFEALRYLSSLLCHMKFCLEFIQSNGFQCLLDVPRPSIAATGVSICIYYLGYCEEAMERVCLLPKSTISNLVKYALWLLECSHDSGRCHATMFFGLTFQFKVILDEFDAQDGLRKLHNLIATLPILSNDALPLNEDAECAARQIVRHVCVAYKRYLEAHLIAKIEQLKRSQLRPPDRTEANTIPQISYKPCKSSPEEVQQQIETLLQFMPFRTHWLPVENFLKLGAITLLLRIIALAYEWNYSGRAETVRCALDVMAIACVMPKVMILLCETVDLPDELPTLGVSIILGAAAGEIVRDADVQKSAIRVLINCVCGPINRVGGSMARFSSGPVNSPNKKVKTKNSEELIQRMWDCVRANSGIMVLLQLMNVKTPIIDADCIRTLACQALVGLTRCATVRQIVSKLPIFQNGELQNLMRDPILQEKRQEHVTFQKYALELLGSLSGRTATSDPDVSLVNIHRASVVAQTNISFNDKQLLQLIHQHLVSKGYTDSASLLQKEANIGHVINSNMAVTHPSKFRYSVSSPVANRVRLSSVHSPVSTVRSNLNASFAEMSPAPAANCTPIKLVRKSSTPQVAATPTAQNPRLQKQITNDPHAKLAVTIVDEFTPIEPPKVTLDSIITEYLTNQHALCKNPMATCPQFNLFAPHKCPDPRPKVATTTNVVMRCARRQLGYQARNLDRRLINSRFCPVQSIRYPNSENGFFTCVRFMPGDQHVVVGDYCGDLRIYNVLTGNEDSCFSAHETYIFNIEPNRTGELLLTSSAWREPLSAMWSVKDYEMKHTFDIQDYVEFSKVSQDKIIGTKGEVATIFDVQTGLEVHRFIPLSHNQYTKNKATFSHNDELVLTDGALFDVNSGTQIRQLDKLNSAQSGVFHPNGREIIANMEIWDMRTFHLLKTVQSLNQCNVKFAEINNALFAYSMEQEIDEDSTFDSSFKTIDAIDYSSIATIDVKRQIYDLGINHFDSQIGIVENQGTYYNVQESVVRLYDVGRRRDNDDEVEEDDEDLVDEDDDDDDDSISDESDTADPLDILGSLRRFHGEQDEDEEDDDEGSDALDDLILEDGGNSDIFNSNSDDSLSLILGSNDDSYTDYSDDTLRMTSEDENAASEPE